LGDIVIFNKNIAARSRGGFITKWREYDEFVILNLNRIVMNIYDNPKSRAIWFSLSNHGRKWKGDEILPPREKSLGYKRGMANQFRAIVVYNPIFPGFIGVPC